jgi:hypothetical protein
MATKEQVQIVIDKMNEAVVMDKDVCERLANTLFPCNDEFIDNSIFFCFGRDEMSAIEKHGAVSAIGFLNGILKELDVPRIAAMKEEDGTFIKFCLFTGD